MFGLVYYDYDYDMIWYHYDYDYDCCWDIMIPYNHRSSSDTKDLKHRIRQVKHYIHCKRHVRHVSRAPLMQSKAAAVVGNPHQTVHWVQRYNQPETTCPFNAPQEAFPIRAWHRLQTYGWQRNTSTSESDTWDFS